MSKSIADHGDDEMEDTEKNMTNRDDKTAMDGQDDRSEVTPPVVGSPRRVSSGNSDSVVRGDPVTMDPEQEEKCGDLGEKIREGFTEQKRQEKEAFHQLIQDNARLKRQCDKMERALERERGKHEATQQKLGGSVENCEQLETKIKEMEEEIRVMIMASKKKSKGGGGVMSDEEAEFHMGLNKNSQVAKYEEEYEEEKERMNYLEVRLMRMTEAQEVKDRKIDELEKEVRERERFQLELEKCVEKTKVEEIRENLANTPQNKDVQYPNKSNMVHQNHVQSTVCTIM